jgi:hypothetical protein
MGTRADFYIRKKNGKMNWKGSQAWDGMPRSIPHYVLGAGTSAAFCHGLYTHLKCHPDVGPTLPSDGWCWPWKNSHTTDFAYVFDERTGKVIVCEWGKPVGSRARITFPEMEVSSERVRKSIESGTSGVIVLG